MGISTMMKPVMFLRAPWKKGKRSIPSESLGAEPGLGPYSSLPHTPTSSLMNMSAGQISCGSEFSLDSSALHTPHSAPMRRRQRAESSITDWLPGCSSPQKGAGTLSRSHKPQDPQSLKRSSSMHSVSSPRRPPRPPTPNLFTPPSSLLYMENIIEAPENHPSNATTKLQPSPSSSVILDGAFISYSEDSESESEEGPRTPKVSGFLEGQILRDSERLPQRTLTYHIYGDRVDLNTSRARHHKMISGSHLESPSPKPTIRCRARSGSTPHLPLPASNAKRSSGLDPIFPLSLFPAPPPLNRLKKVPMPLPLQHDPSSALSPSTTILSSPTSVKMTPPTSPKFAPSSRPLRSSIGRGNGCILPPPHSPPTSPLPDPPTSSIIPFNPIMPRSSLPPQRLRAVRSTSHLRREMQTSATHRITSSDPASEWDKVEPADTQAFRLHFSRVTQDVPAQSSGEQFTSQVHWGYAI